MRIELRQPYKSIATLETEDLPDFAVLIGRNGAGKTQLLGALKEGLAAILGIGVDEIESYDMVSFGPPFSFILWTTACRMRVGLPMSVLAT